MIIFCNNWNKGGKDVTMSDGNNISWVMRILSTCSYLFRRIRADGGSSGMILHVADDHLVTELINNVYKI